MSTPIIGLTGKRLAGKSTIAEYICANHGYTRFSFASLMKQMLITMGVPKEHIFGDKKEEVVPHLGVTGRHLMQTIGTQWGRDCIAQDVWVKALMDHPVFLARVPTGVIIDDVRFDNEADAIRARGGVIVQVVREGRPEAGDAADQHVSEVPITAVDYHIQNAFDDPAVYERLDNFVIDLKTNCR